MPLNFDALIRYHTIDKCLQNRFRKWDVEKLGKACFEALDEVRNRTEKTSVSKRTIENDIRIMRSDLLGYNAPIARNKGFYSYTDKAFSIKNATLSQQDIGNISLAAKVLGQYKGFGFIDDLSGILDKLETRIEVNKAEELQQVVQFEHIPESRGTEYMRGLIEAILRKIVIEISYQRFGSDEIKKHRVHPYLLKEFRNRWYVVGMNAKHRDITTYALDRILGIEALDDISYETSNSFNPETYFKHTIGISYSGEAPVEVIIEVVYDFVPYLLTQPLHQSQQLIEKKAGSSVFKLHLVINNELETLLAGFGDFITVHSPAQLKQMLITKLQKAQKNYS
ncbi:MAG TPA: WYL domain-containing protein [Daejeonella sp.]